MDGIIKLALPSSYKIIGNLSLQKSRSLACTFFVIKS